uniref:Uncharacterized protein n=1 Tax=Panagrolaimus superbus TaxID=310955 RepID=A0A914Y0E1_9BILA
MAVVFRTNTNELIDELVDLIDYGVIDARIDPIEEKLYRLDENATMKNSKRLAKIQKDLEERTRVIVLRAALAINGVNPAKEFEIEMEASGMAGGRRRRMAPFDDPDPSSDDDIDMVNQTQQLSFSSGRGLLNRFVNRFTNSGRQSSSQNPQPPNVAGIGHPNASSNDHGLSDTDMMDP